MSNTPACKAAQYAHSAYRQRRIDIADEYSAQCAANSDRLIEELAVIAVRYDLAPTRVVIYAFGKSRPDFIGRVCRSVVALKARQGQSGD